MKYTQLSCKIKCRQVAKPSPLPSITFCNQLHAAWPELCDATSAYEYNPSFKVVWPSTKQRNVFPEGTCPQIDGIVSDVGVCTSCWQYSCRGCENLTWRCAPQDTSISDLKREKEEALLLCGYQAQLAKENWSQTASEIIKNLACAARERQLFFSRWWRGKPCSLSSRKPRWKG